MGVPYSPCAQPLLGRQNRDVGLPHPALSARAGRKFRQLEPACRPHCLSRKCRLPRAAGGLPQSAPVLAERERAGLGHGHRCLPQFGRSGGFCSPKYFCRRQHSRGAFLRGRTLTAAGQFVPAPLRLRPPVWGNHCLWIGRERSPYGQGTASVGRQPCGGLCRGCLPYPQQSALVGASVPRDALDSGTGPLAAQCGGPNLRTRKQLCALCPQKVQQPRHGGAFSQCSLGEATWQANAFGAGGPGLWG